MKCFFFFFHSFVLTTLSMAWTLSNNFFHCVGLRDIPKNNKINIYRFFINKEKEFCFIFNIYLLYQALIHQYFCHYTSHECQQRKLHEIQLLQLVFYFQDPMIFHCHHFYLMNFPSSWIQLCHHSLTFFPLFLVSSWTFSPPK